MPLVVYKSSAGSGKTTTLVNEYLRICLKHPEDFSHILAITFTNKAAHEMRERIIWTLKTIINNPWQQDERIVLLFKKTQLSEQEFQVKAKKLLTLILHRFEDFSVSTIDAFIHKVIRTFANEVHLPANFEVVLNHNDLIPEVVQSIYDKVGTDAVLTEILVKFVLNQAEDEKSPDPTIMLNSFIAGQLGEESFIQVKKLAEIPTHELWLIIKKLLSQLENQQKAIEKCAKEAINLINTHGISASDLAGGSRGIYSFFNKAAQATTLDAEKLPATATVLNNLAEDKWTSSKANTAVKQNVESIKEELTLYFERLTILFEPYFLLFLLNKKIYTLALVHELRLVLTAFTEETGKVHISEFNKLVYNEVAEQPVPFIYERLGKKYKYFLIDEFQDTSVLQWNNLLPLIDESLAFNRFNMLVGDAKQAIYRFRNGDVELFANLPKLHGKGTSLLSAQRENQLETAYEEVILDTNWRSNEEIIRFNNQFFDFLKSQSGEYVERIYANHEQKNPEQLKPGGLVNVELIAADNKEDLLALKHEKINSIVSRLLDHGYALKDIGILCRTGESVRAHAAFLINQGYAVLSEESLLVANAPDVQIMAAFFQLLANPMDAIAQTTIVENMRFIHHPTVPTDQYLREFHAKRYGTIGGLLSFFGVEATENEVAQKPHTEVADFVWRNLIKTNTANVFVQYYYEFLHQAPQSLDGLNRLWQEKKNNYFIASPENTNAIHVMTVHKSKGLDFTTVIADADVEMIRPTKREFWMDIQMPENERFRVGLFPLSKALSLIKKEDVYLQEQNRSLLDYLNILYVAFTRAQKALFILANNNDDVKRGKLAAYLIDFLKSTDQLQDNIYSYSFGSLPVPKMVSKEPSQGHLESWPSEPWNDNRWMTKADEMLFFISTDTSVRDYGIMVHQLLSQVISYRDIDPIVDRHFSSGLFTNEESVLLKSVMNQLTRHPELEVYFTPGVWCRNEAEVMLEAGGVVRPDRIVKLGEELIIIDYKTGLKRPEHGLQMNSYKLAFMNLGYTSIRSLLVYLQDEIEIEEVL